MSAPITIVSPWIAREEYYVAVECCGAHWVLTEHRREVKCRICETEFRLESIIKVREQGWVLWRNI